MYVYVDVFWWYVDVMLVLSDDIWCYVVVLVCYLMVFNGLIVLFGCMFVFFCYCRGCFIYAYFLGARIRGVKLWGDAYLRYLMGKNNGKTIHSTYKNLTYLDETPLKRSPRSVKGRGKCMCGDFALVLDDIRPIYDDLSVWEPSKKMNYSTFVVNKL